MIPRTDKAVIAEARSFVGTRWEHTARLKGVAVDCVGLITGVADAMGYPYQDFTSYGVVPNGQLVPRLSRFLDPAAGPKPGQIGVFWFDRGSRMPQHVGIFSDHCGLGLIHTYMDVGRVVEHAFDDRWRRRLCHVFEYRGLKYLIGN